MKTEEEQVEALKNWWKDNGKSLILIIAVALGGVLSWNAYQDHQVGEAEAASIYFQELMNNAPAGHLSDTQIAQIRHNSDLLRAEFGSATYAQFAALMVARVEVQLGDLPAAASQLQWVVEQQGDAEVNALASIRLAKVLSEQGQHSEALALLVDGDDAWQPARLETRGDIFLVQGDVDAAREAYTAASVIAISSGVSKPLLGLKLDNISQ